MIVKMICNKISTNGTDYDYGFDRISVSDNKKSYDGYMTISLKQVDAFKIGDKFNMTIAKEEN